MRFLFAHALALALLMMTACAVEAPGDDESEIDQDATVLASGPTASKTDPSTDTGPRFYRVLALP